MSEPQAAADDYEQTTGHVITCTAAFTDICDCPDNGPTVREAVADDRRWDTDREGA